MHLASETVNLGLSSLFIARALLTALTPQQYLW
jgi:hypothetical protein